MRNPTTRARRAATAAAATALALALASGGCQYETTADATTHATMSQKRVAQVARKAGFRGRALTIAVAVAFAESSGNARARNTRPPDNSFGLWQINMIGKTGRQRRRTFHLRSNAALLDPATNARVTFAISHNGDNWQPWGSFTSGAYRRHLAAARAAVRG